MARLEDLKVLKIDLDKKTRKSALKSIREPLSYMVDMNFIKLNQIEDIEIIKKTTYGCRIYFRKPFKDVKSIVIMQLLFGSDYRKEINTLLNYYALNMQYFNRMFTIKKYKNGDIKVANIEYVTKEVFDYVNSKNRKKYRN